MQQPPEYLTTREVAERLRLKQRKVYELVQGGRIPHVRVTGKLLFPRRLVDAWVERHVVLPEAGLARPPLVVAGSHDPLLEWALRSSGSELALHAGGSLDGLHRLADGRAMVAGLHLLDPESGEHNVAASRATGVRDLVLIAWAFREQGLVLATHAADVRGLGDVAARRLRIAGRQEGSGAAGLLGHLLERAGLDAAQIAWSATAAPSETEVATQIVDGEADCGLAIRAVARRLGLAFLPLHRERFDLAMRRRDYFEPPVQALLAFARGEAFQKRASELGGYDVSCLGQVIANA